MKDQSRRLSYLRVFIQIVASIILFLGLIVGPFGLVQWPPVGYAPRAALVGTSFLGRPFPDGLSVPTFACYYPSGRTATCVLWQIQNYLFPSWTPGPGNEVTYISAGLERLSIAFGLVLLMSIMLGRFFCGWICPFGLYMDILSRLRKSLRISHRNLSEETNRALRQFRYILIATILIICFVVGSKTIIGIELISESQYGAVLREPFCQVCPVKPLLVLLEGASGLMNLDYIFSQTTGVFYESGWFITTLNLGILTVVTLASFKVRRLWCRMCPMGGLIALFNRFTPLKRISMIHLNKIEEKCTKCGICKRVCHPQITEVYEGKGGDVTTSACTLCFRCVEMCPYEDCLEIRLLKRPIYRSRNWLEQAD